MDINGDGKLVPSFTASPLEIEIPLADSEPLQRDLSLGAAAPPRSGELDLLDDAGNVIQAFGLSGLQTFGSHPEYDKKAPVPEVKVKEYVGTVSILR